MGLLTEETDHKALAVKLAKALEDSGFQVRSTENADGWVWITYIGGDGQGKVAVRPESEKPGSVIIFKIPEA